MATWVSKFAAAHPLLTKFIVTAVGAVSAILLVAGAINLVQGAFTLLRTAMMTNPLILIITAIALAAALIYTNWVVLKYGLQSCGTV